MTSHFYGNKNKKTWLPNSDFALLTLRGESFLHDRAHIWTIAQGCLICSAESFTICEWFAPMFLKSPFRCQSLLLPCWTNWKLWPSWATVHGAEQLWQLPLPLTVHTLLLARSGVFLLIQSFAPWPLSLSPRQCQWNYLLGLRTYYTLPWLLC